MNKNNYRIAMTFDCKYIIQKKKYREWRGVSIEKFDTKDQAQARLDKLLAADAPLAYEN